jgi:hypothetical protein
LSTTNIIGHGSRAREQSLGLFRGMVERGLDKWWFCQASLNFADDEEVLRKALHTLAATRSLTATSFAWHSNHNYRRVALA